MMVDDVAAYLATQGFGTVGTTIFPGFLPDEHVSCIALFQKGGYAPIQPQDIERPALHVMIRGTDHTAAENLANDVYTTLHKAWELTLSGRRYLYFRALTSPTFLYADWSNDPPNFVFSIDFIVTKENE
jgi:hypothetical protein